MKYLFLFTIIDRMLTGKLIALKLIIFVAWEKVDPYHFDNSDVLCNPIFLDWSLILASVTLKYLKVIDLLVDFQKFFS